MNEPRAGGWSGKAALLLGLAAAAASGWALAIMPDSTLFLLAGALLLAGIGAALLTRPLLGLALTLIVAPFGALESRLGILPGLLSTGQLLLFAVLFAWGVRGLVLRRQSLPSFPVQPFLLTFIGVSALSLLGAVSLSLGVKELMKWLELLVVIWLILDLQNFRPGAGFRAERKLLAFLPVILLPALVQAAIGIAQFFQSGGPDSFQILGRFFRAFGTFEQPNPFGGFIAFHLLLAAGLGAGFLAELVARMRRGEPRRGGLSTGALGVLLLLLAAAGALLLLALLASWSRGAWLGFAAGAAALVFFWPRRRATGLALGLTALLLLLALWRLDFIPPSVTERIASAGDFQLRDLREIELTEANYALLERLAFWEAAAGMARSRLWLGIGFGGYDAAYGDVARAGWPQSLGHAHNYYLNLLAEVGLLGLLAYLLFWGAVMIQSSRLLAVLDGWPRGLALGLMGVWVALAAHHLVDKLYVNNIYLHLAAFLAVQQLLVNLSPVRPDPPSSVEAVSVLPAAPR